MAEHLSVFRWSIRRGCRRYCGHVHRRLCQLCGEGDKWEILGYCGHLEGNRGKVVVKFERKVIVEIIVSALRYLSVMVTYQHSTKTELLRSHHKTP